MVDVVLKKGSWYSYGDHRCASSYFGLNDWIFDMQCAVMFAK